jgi:hypothetical protein
MPVVAGVRYSIFFDRNGVTCMFIEKLKIRSAQSAFFTDPRAIARMGKHPTNTITNTHLYGRSPARTIADPHANPTMAARRAGSRLVCFRSIVEIPSAALVVFSISN